MTPQRIQRKRTKGWRMPEGAVYVGRPTRWGNPWRIGDTLHAREGKPVRITPALANRLYLNMWAEFGEFYAGYELEPLRGHDLVCWCPLQDEHGNRVPCHADVLLELANR